MATSNNVKLSVFDLDKALKGACLATSDTGTTEGNITAYALNFRLVNPNSISEKYSAVLNKSTYYFNDEGECSANSLYHLFLVVSQLEITKDSVATKGDGETEKQVSIDEIQPKEHIAILAMQSILAKFPDPLSLDNGQIMLIADMSFKIAQQMVNTAADYRKDVKIDENPASSINVNPNAVTDTTDKLLYNINSGVNSMQKSLASINTALNKTS